MTEFRFKIISWKYKAKTNKIKVNRDTVHIKSILQVPDMEKKLGLTTWFM